MKKTSKKEFQRDFEKDVRQKTEQQGAMGAIALAPDLKVRTRVFFNLFPRPLKLDDNPILDPSVITGREITIKYQTFYYFKSKHMSIPRKENEYFVINSAQMFDNKHCRYGSYEDFLERGGEWAKWMVEYTNLTPGLFEIARQNECASFPIAVKWEKLAEAQGSPIFTFNGIERKKIREEKERQARIKEEERNGHSK